ncbi:MAG: hypothetical protein ACRDQA_08015 [Nocardioidaceae bacterium]
MGGHIPGGGPFDFYPVGSTDISSAADETTHRTKAIDALKVKGDQKEKQLVSQVEGTLKSSAANAMKDPAHHAKDVNGKALFASACLREFGQAIDKFNFSKKSKPRCVSKLNSVYAKAGANNFGVPDVDYPEDATDKEKGDLDDDHLDDVGSAGKAKLAELKKEYHHLEGWLDGMAQDSANRLKRGPNAKDLKELYSIGALPSWVWMVYPDVNFNKVTIKRLPYDLRNLTAAQLKELTKGIVLKSTKAFIEGEVDLLSWHVEGKAEAQYKVFGDGHVEMVLRLEAGLGRNITVGGQKVGVSGGGTAELALQFKSAAEAQEFLDNLDDKAFDLDWGDAAHAPEAIAQNVASYVMAQNIKDARVGVYGQASIDFGGDSGQVSLRAEGYYDLADGERGIKLTGKAHVEGGGASADAEVSADLTMGENYDFKSLKLEAKVSGSADAQAMGIDIPGLGAGEEAQITFNVDENNPYAKQITEAASSGNMTKATQLAVQHAQVVVKQSHIVSESGEEIDAKVFGQGAHVEYGVEHHQADKVWVKPTYSQQYLEVQ